MSEFRISNIYLLESGKRPNQGRFTFKSNGFLWKNPGNRRKVEGDKANIAEVNWMELPTTRQLNVHCKDGNFYKFEGFSDLDKTRLANYFQNTCGITLVESGSNRIDVNIKENMLVLKLDSEKALELPLRDVSQALIGEKNEIGVKNEVELEFHDKKTGPNVIDSLTNLTFHIPDSNKQFVDDEGHSPAEVFHEKIMAMANVSDQVQKAAATFDSINILTPRGRYTVELHQSFLLLQRQANQFNIPYSSVEHLFQLPKPNQPDTYGVVTLNSPISIGKTSYQHIVLNFEPDFNDQCKLSTNKDLLNQQCNDMLQSSDSGLIHEMFFSLLSTLASREVTKHGPFVSRKNSCAVNSSLKTEDGFLYPLENSFFFLPKPPTLILHDKIAHVVPKRHVTGGTNFDLLIRLETEHEYIFGNILNSEYHNLKHFISAKRLKIKEIKDTNTTDGVVQLLKAPDDHTIDPHLTKITNEAGEDNDEEDEDFDPDMDDGDSPMDDS